MEIRIKITVAEFEDLQNRSTAAGFPSVNAYGRSLLFPQHDYEKKWAEVKAFIASCKAGEVFYIRDALPNTPSLFGRWAYEQQNDLGIEPDGKDRTGTNRWRKQFNLQRTVNCPHCNVQNQIDLEDECSVTTEERPMGAGNLFEFDYEETCSSCEKIFKVSGYVSEYPVGALEHETVTTFLPEGGE
jgi:hypothetical protein